MPNGHGGIPRYGAPVLLALLFTCVHLTRPPGHSVFFNVLELVLILLFCRRLAWHLAMWRVSEYDGAYVSGEERGRASVRSWLLMVLFMAAAGAAWYLSGGWT